VGGSNRDSQYSDVPTRHIEMGDVQARQHRNGTMVGLASETLLQVGAMVPEYSDAHTRNIEMGAGKRAYASADRRRGT
jgi:hypothetical protein